MLQSAKEFFASDDWSHQGVEDRLRRSLFVFAVHGSGSRAKKPKGTSGGGVPTPKAYGLQLEQLGLCIVDIDVHQTNGHGVWQTFLQQYELTLPSTLTVETPSGGRHLYFRTQPGQTVETCAGPSSPLEGVDLLGNDGQIHVVGPGSFLSKSRWLSQQGQYRVVDEVAPAPISSQLLQALTREHAQRLVSKFPLLPALQDWRSLPPLEKTLQTKEWTLNPQAMLELLVAIDYLVARKKYDNPNVDSLRDIAGGGGDWWTHLEKNLDESQLVTIFETNLDRVEYASNSDYLMRWEHLLPRRLQNNNESIF